MVNRAPIAAPVVKKESARFDPYRKFSNYFSVSTVPKTSLVNDA